MSEAAQSGRPRVVVLGGGFAGIGAARALKDVDVDVVLVDKHDFHTFQPLLYQVATDLLETAVVGHPLRDLFHEQSNVTLRQATVSGIDLAGREVQLAETEPLTYEYLVLALGAEVNFFGVEGAPEHAFPMYTLADAVRLKEHVSKQWAAADREDPPGTPAAAPQPWGRCRRLASRQRRIAPGRGTAGPSGARSGTSA